MTVTSDLGQYAKSLNIFSTVVGKNPGRRRCTAVVGIHSIQYNVIRLALRMAAFLYSETPVISARYAESLSRIIDDVIDQKMAKPTL